MSAARAVWGSFSNYVSELEPAGTRQGGSEQGCLTRGYVCMCLFLPPGFPRLGHQTAPDNALP